MLTGMAGRAVNRYLANRFAQVAASEANDPSAIYRLLLAMEEQGVEALISNASSNDLRIAERARHVLFVRIDTWLSELAKKDPAELSNRLNHFLKKLEAASPELTQTGKKWANQIAYRILQIAPQLRVQDRGIVISSIDELLETLERTPDRLEIEFEVTEVPSLAKSLKDKMLKAIPDEPRSLQEDSTLGIVSLPMATEQFQVESPRTPTDYTIRTVPNEVTDLSPEPWQPNWQSKGSLERQPLTQLEDKPRESETDQLDPNIHFDSLQDLLPIEIAQLDDRQLLSLLMENAEKLAVSNSPAPRASGPSDRTRFGQEPPEPEVVTPEGERLYALRLALTERGYSTVQLDQIRLFLSNNEEDRLRLVENLMVSYSGDHSRLLLQLASDPSPEVRVAALSMLGSSSQRVLVEAAWNRSLRDSDPRVAALADGLQARLENQF